MSTATERAIGRLVQPLTYPKRPRIWPAFWDALDRYARVDALERRSFKRMQDGTRNLMVTTTAYNGRRRRWQALSAAKLVTLTALMKELP